MLPAPDDILDPSPQSERLWVQFSYQPMQDTAQSVAEGRPIFRDVEHVQIVIPGDRTLTVHRPVEERDRKRFAQEYAAWKAGQEQQVSGTPVGHLPGITRAQVEELAHFKVRTVEQLAELSDANAQNIGPVLALRQRAQDWLNQAKSGAQLGALRDENHNLRNELEAMRAQMREQADAIERLQKGKRAS